MKYVNRLFIVGASVLLIVSGARAASYYYNEVNPTGDWNTIGSWSTQNGAPVDIVPSSTDNAFITFSSTVTISTPMQITSVSVGGGSHAATLTINDNLTTSGYLYIGKSADINYTGYGAVMQTGGTVTVNGGNGLILYGANNGTNSYTMTGGVFDTLTGVHNIAMYSQVTEGGSNTFAPAFTVSSGTVLTSALTLGAGVFTIGSGALVQSKNNLSFGTGTGNDQPGGAIVMAGGTLQGAGTANSSYLGIGMNTGNMKTAKISGHGTILVYNNNAINGLGVTADSGTLIYTGVNDDGTANHNYYKSDGGWFAQNGGLLKLDWKANNNDLTRSGNKIAWGLWDQTNISNNVSLSGTDNVHALLLTVKNGSAATDLDISFAAADIGTLGGVTLGDITNSDGVSFLNYYNVAVTAGGALDLTNVQIVLDAAADSEVTGLYYLATGSSAWALLDTNISDRVLTADFSTLGVGAHGAGLYALGVIPEPTTVFLLVLGGGIILALAIKRWRPAGGHAKRCERAAHL